MVAADERAKMLERHRRGKLPAARAGAVSIPSGAPYGSRDVGTPAGGGHARSDLVPDDARVVQQVVAWGGRDRRAIGDVCRPLMPAGERTRRGRSVGDRRVVWARLKQPASSGQAAFGQTRPGPRRPQLRAHRGRAPHPRRAASDDDVAPEAWWDIPVPAMVAPEVFAAVPAQRQEHRRQARQSRRGARSLLQGWRQCPPCG
jgi:site-specific DNA recombinase